MRSTRYDLDSLASAVLKGAPSDQAVVLAWPLACGSAVAQKTEALGFADAILRIRVPDRGWQMQLQSFSARYVERLTKLAGTAVKRIEYEIARADEPNLSR